MPGRADTLSGAIESSAAGQPDRQQLDDRTWRDVAIWAKPLKFMLSKAAFAATTAWFVGLLPRDMQTSPSVRSLSWALVITSTFEVGYISLQAALGSGSHHKLSDPLHAAMFGLMAIAAVGLTTTQALLAWLIGRHSPERDTVFGRSVVVGLLLTFVLATARLTATTSRCGLAPGSRRRAGRDSP